MAVLVTSLKTCSGIWHWHIYWSSPQQAKSVQHVIEVTLEEAYQGTTRMFQLQTDEACAACGGTGRSTRYAVELALLVVARAVSPK